MRALVLLLAGCTATTPVDDTDSDAAGGPQAAWERAFPELAPVEPSAGLPPFDGRGFRPFLIPPDSGFSVLERNLPAIELVRVDGILGGWWTDGPEVFAAIDQPSFDGLTAAAGCAGERVCVEDALGWTDAFLDTVADTVAAQPQAADLGARIRERGTHHDLAAEADDVRLLREALRRDLTHARDLLLPELFRAPASVVDQIINDHEDTSRKYLSVLSTVPILAVRGMYATGRDEAGRFEPLHATNGDVWTRAKSIDWTRWPYTAIVVPGAPPADLDTTLSPEAAARCDLAAARFKAGVAPFIVTSGGYVSPPGVQYAEGSQMARYLRDVHGVPEAAVLVEPYARDLDATVRNATRRLLEIGAPPGRPALLTTDTAQSARLPDDVAASTEAAWGYTPWRAAVRRSPTDVAFWLTGAALTIDPREVRDP